MHTEMSAIEAAVKELRKKVQTTRGVVIARYAREEANVQHKGKGDANGMTKVNDKPKSGEKMEDVEMEDVEMEEAPSMPSFEDIATQLAAAANDPTTSKDDSKRKGKAPVKFGDLPYVEGKNMDQEKKKERDDDEKWKDFFLK
jgi:hypothetical protein